MTDAPPTVVEDERPREPCDRSAEERPWCWRCAGEGYRCEPAPMPDDAWEGCP